GTGLVAVVVDHHLVALLERQARGDQRGRPGNGADLRQQQGAQVLAVLLALAHQLHAEGLGVGRDQLDAHLRAAAANLADPAHYRHAPGLAGAVLDAQQLAGLELRRYFPRPAQAVSAGTVVDDRQLVARIALGGLRRRRLVDLPARLE